jgi:signal transduction histidine kinase
MDFRRFQTIADYVDFGPKDSELLRAVHAQIAPVFGPAIDDFYAAIEANPRARAVITGGQPQIERLKRTLTAWIASVLLDPHDEAYVLAHARIGRVHVRIGLPQEFMFTAMNRIRIHLKAAIERCELDASTLSRTLAAADKILDLELAIMLDTYREDLNDKIRTGERLATIGQLAASIGHELRNPLSTIESSLFLMDQRLKRLGLDDPQIAKHHEKIAKQIKHCGKTITNLLDLARERPPRRQPVDVASLLLQASEAAGIPTTLEVDIDIPSGLTIYADPDDLVHVLGNLLTNASQAQNSVGVVHVRAESHQGGTQVFVQDSGPGVPVEVRHRIFDALFTTKSHGTGLGLALCRRVVFAHGGELTLEPSPTGACFRLWVPNGESPRTIERNPTPAAG